MYKKIQWLLVVTCLLIASPTLLAAQQVNIGVVNVPKVLKDSPQAEALSKALSEQFADREKALVAEQEQLRKLDEDYQKNKDVMSKSESETKAKELREKIKEFKRKSAAFNEDLSAARNEALGKLQNDIYKAINELAKDEGYDLILSEAVLYASDKIDITDKLIKRLEAQK